MSKKQLENVLPVRVTILQQKKKAQLFKKKTHELFQKQRVLCEKHCYSNVDWKRIVTVDTADELRECKQKCKIPFTDLNHFLDNINYLSENKMKMCTKTCKKKTHTSFVPNTSDISSQMKTHDECMWTCYNKLDRRYKEYWRNQKEDIVKRHYFKSYQELKTSFDNTVL